MFLTDGATRISAAVFQELRNAIFASVAQKAIHRVAGNVFQHLLNLDLNFHLTRQTGGLTRAMDRGTKGISFLLTSMVFHILPTALEIGLVCGILVSFEILSQVADVTTDSGQRAYALDRHISMAQSSLLSLQRPWWRTLRSPS